MAGNAAPQVVITSPLPGAPVATICDISGVLVVSAGDVQRMVDEALGVLTPSHDLNHDGQVNVADIEKITAAAIGSGCH